MTNGLKIAISDQFRAAFADALAQVNTTDITGIELVEAVELPENGGQEYTFTGVHADQQFPGTVNVGSFNGGSLKFEDMGEQEQRVFMRTLASMCVSAIGYQAGLGDVLGEYDDDGEDGTAPQ